MALGARLLAAGLVLAWLPPAAHAQPRTEIDERLAFVERELEAGQADARSWRHSWMAVYGGFTLGGLAFAALVPDRGLRIDALVSSAKSGLGFFSIALRPMRAAHGLDDLEAWPAATPEQRALRLHRAEQALRQAAEDEELGRSWLARIAAATVNLAGSYVLWLGYQRYASGWLALPAGLAVGELQIRTQPSAAIESWQAYRARWQPTAAAAPPPAALRLSVGPIPGGRGVLLGGVF